MTMIKLIDKAGKEHSVYHVDFTEWLANGAVASYIDKDGKTAIVNTTEDKRPVGRPPKSE